MSSVKPVVALLCVLGLPLVVLAKPVADPKASSEYDIQYGLIKQSESGIYVAKKTNTIPLRLQKHDPDFMFGYIIRHRHGKGFAHRAVITMPKPAAQTGDKADKTSEKGKNAVYEFTRPAEDGDSFIIIKFDEGDKPGKYTMQVYADNKLIQVIRFNVVSEDKPAKQGQKSKQKK